jgi:sialate O-acetylesterase
VGATQKSDDWRMEHVPFGILKADVSLPLSRQDSQRITEALREQDRMRRLAEARRFIDSSTQPESNRNPDRD